MHLKGGNRLRGRLDSVENKEREVKVILRDVVELPSSGNGYGHADSALPTISEVKYSIGSVVRVELAQNERLVPSASLRVSFKTFFRGHLWRRT